MAEILQGRTAISIHTPQVGRDKSQRLRRLGVFISIHTPQVGRDRKQANPRLLKIYFNPHAPGGARHQYIG